MIKLSFIEGEGYIIKTDEQILDHCFLCNSPIDDDEVFYVCEKSQKSYCSNCKLKAPCHSPSYSIIPSSGTTKELCIHRKILRKEKIR